MPNLTKVYLPDEVGDYHTYLPITELAELLDLTVCTLHSWIRAGSVRVTPPLRGRRNASVEDATLLRLLTPTESRELGLRRITEHQSQINAARFARHQDRTLPAECHRQHWDDYDVQYLLDAIQVGEDIEEIARALGRTYAAVEDRLELLREEGELPRPERDESRKWLARVLAEVLPEEADRLEEVSR